MNRIRKQCTCILVFMTTLLLFTTHVSNAQEILPKDTTMDIEWSPDNTLFATAQKDGNITIRDENGNLLQTIQADPKESYTVSWSPDGKWLASGGSDSTIKIWNVESSRLVQSIEGFPYGVLLTEWQPKGNLLLASGLDDFLVVDTSTGRSISAGGVSITDMKWSPEGSQFAYSSTAGIGIVSIENAKVNPKQFEDAMSAGTRYSVDWNASGDQIVSADGLDGTVRLWDAASGKQLSVLLQTKELIQRALFIDNAGTRVAAISDMGTLYQIDIPSGKVEQLKYPGADLWTMAWNPIKDKLVIGGALSGDVDPNMPGLTRSLAGSGVLEVVTLSKSES